MRRPLLRLFLELNLPNQRPPQSPADFYADLLNFLDASFRGWRLIRLGPMQITKANVALLERLLSTMRQRVY